MKKVSRKKILVTGGLGYLGGRICKDLIKLDFEIVIGTSRKDAQLPSELSLCTLKTINLEDCDSLDKVCENVDIIIHLAAMNAKECHERPDRAILINGIGTLNLLNSAKANGVKNFIYFSTVHVYGTPLIGVITENTMPKPINDYSLTHHIAENYVIKENKQNVLNGTILRLSNTVGSPINKNCDCWSLVVNDLCKQAVINKRIKLISNENVLRDYVSISTVCDAVIDIISNNDILNNVSGEKINITFGKSINLKDLTCLIAERCNIVLGFYPDVKFSKKIEKTRDSNINNLVISNKKAQDLGLINGSSLSLEIDKLLLNCNEWFEPLEIHN